MPFQFFLVQDSQLVNREHKENPAWEFIISPDMPSDGEPYGEHSCNEAGEQNQPFFFQTEQREGFSHADIENLYEKKGRHEP